MDEPTWRGMLSKWGLDELITSFEEQEFDDESFQMLTEEDIRQLVPKMGLRLKFVRHYRAQFWKEVPQEMPVRLDCSDADSLFSSTGDEALSEVSTQKAPSLSPADTIILPTSSNSSTSSPLSWLHDPLDEFLAPDIANPELNKQSQSHQLGGNEQLEATCSGSQPQDRKATLFDVRKILLEDKNGAKLVDKIDGTRALLKGDKRKLCHILAAHVVSLHGYKPSSCIKADMAQGIIDAFPFLRDPDGETGYESFYCRGSKQGPAAGTLEDRISYLRRLSYGKEGVPKLKRIRDVQQACQKKKPDTRIETEKPVLQLQWLRSNLWDDDPELASKYIAETAKYRRQWMMASEGQQRTMADILEEFPYLLNPGMIEKDFSFIEPNATQKLYEKWPRLSDQLIGYAKTTLTWGNLDIMPDKPIDELTLDEKHNVAIHLLPYLFPGRRKGGRISAKQSSAAFVDFQCESTNLEFYLKNITEKPQPYVLILGGSRMNPQQVFLIIKRHALPQTTLMKAIDVCYKAMFVFNLEYQKACIGTWEFLQKTVYEHQGNVKCSQIREFRTFCACVTDRDNISIS